jgi:hypothetical protein
MVGVFAAAAPVSSASAYTWPFSLPSSPSGAQTGTSGCYTSNAPSLSGPAGGTANAVCGALLSFVGPSTGQIASVIGPTIIGSPVLAPISVSAGPVTN